MGFASRLRQFREAKGLTQEELAHRCGYKTQSRIGNYESVSKSARKPKLVELPRIAKELGVRVAQFFDDDPDHEPDWSDVRAYAQAVGLGDGKEADEYAEAHKLKFRASSLARKRLDAGALAVVYGKGDSMLPRIRSGDAILYDQTDTTPRHRVLYVIRRGKEYSAKRCIILDGTVYFDALNPEGDHRWNDPIRQDNKREPIEVIGRVRWIGSWED